MKEKGLSLIGFAEKNRQISSCVTRAVPNVVITWFFQTDGNTVSRSLVVGLSCLVLRLIFLGT
jgi:hypothetical protein